MNLQTRERLDRRSAQEIHPYIGGLRRFCTPFMSCLSIVISSKRRTRRSSLRAFGLIIFAIAAITVLAPARRFGYHLGILPIIYQHPQQRGAVASLDARCSSLGIDVLQRGGNAADAVRSPQTNNSPCWMRCNAKLHHQVIVTQFCLGVVGRSER